MSVWSDNTVTVEATNPDSLLTFHSAAKVTDAGPNHEPYIHGDRYVGWVKILEDTPARLQISIAEKFMFEMVGVENIVEIWAKAHPDLTFTLRCLYESYLESIPEDQIVFGCDGAPVSAYNEVTDGFIRKWVNGELVIDTVIRDVQPY